MACHSRHHVLLLSLVLAVCTLPSLVSAGVSFKSLGNATISIQGFKYNPETNTTSQLVNQTIKVKETILLRWSPLPTAAAAAKVPSFKTAHVKMCYGPASTVNRGWRKAIDDISLDRQCHRKIIDVPWTNGTSTATYELSEDLPGAYYRFRIYALNSTGQVVAYGQTNTSSIFTVIPITGRSTGLDVAVGVLSAVSGLTLAGYFLREQSQKKKMVT
jgi:hypothetical protein